MKMFGGNHSTQDLPNLLALFALRLNPKNFVLKLHSLCGTFFEFLFHLSSLAAH